MIELLSLEVMVKAEINDRSVIIGSYGRWIIELLSLEVMVKAEINDRSVIIGSYGKSVTPSRIEITRIS